MRLRYFGGKCFFILISPAPILRHLLSFSEEITETEDDSLHSLAEHLANVSQAGFTATVFSPIVKKSSNNLILIRTRLNQEGSDTEWMADVTNSGRLPGLIADHGYCVGYCGNKWISYERVRVSARALCLFSRNLFFCNRTCMLNLGSQMREMEGTRVH